MRILSSKIVLGMLLASAATVAGAQTAVPYRKIDQPLQQSVIANPPEGSAIRVKKAETFTKNPPQLGESPGVPRVPDVVGLFWNDAESALIQAGFQFKATYEDQPDPSVLYGHVRATVPAAGSMAPDGKVELLIPRAASRLGTGALALSDIDRREGFDLDEGQYQEVLRGADIVLRKHEDEPHVGTNGSSTYYSGHGLYIEPSDNAVLAPVDADGKVSDLEDLGTALYFAACRDQLKRGSAAGVEIAERGATICIRTSLGALAVVQFRLSDNPFGEVSDFKFHYAIFPPQVAAPTRPSGFLRRIRK